MSADDFMECVDAGLWLGCGGWRPGLARVLPDFHVIHEHRARLTDKEDNA